MLYIYVMVDYYESIRIFKYYFWVFYMKYLLIRKFYVKVGVFDEDIFILKVVVFFFFKFFSGFFLFYVLEVRIV